MCPLNIPIISDITGKNTRFHSLRDQLFLLPYELFQLPVEVRNLGGGFVFLPFEFRKLFHMTVMDSYAPFEVSNCFVVLPFEISTLSIGVSAGETMQVRHGLGL